MENFSYVYGIVQRGAYIPPELTGLYDAPLAMAAWQDLAAITSPIESATLPTIPAFLWCHEAIVEELCQAGPTLPVRFGTVLADPAAVAQAIAGKYEVLLADMARVGGKVELGLTILWDTAADQNAAPSEQQAAVTTVPAAMKPSDAGKHYLDARRAHYRFEAAQQNKVRTVVAALEQAFHPYTLEHRYRMLFSPRLTLRAAYLVCPGQVQEFQHTVEEVCEQQPDCRWLLSGPWPPYTFVTGAGKVFQQGAGLKLDGTGA